MASPQVCGASPPPPDEEAEEIPLLIRDFGCANSFEVHVKAIEQYVTSLVDHEPLLRSLLVPAPPIDVEAGRLGGGGGGSSSSATTATPPANQPWPLLSAPVDIATDTDTDTDHSAHHVDAAAKVFGTTIALYAPSTQHSAGDADAGATEAAAAPATLDPDTSVVVEVHVHDAAHPITQQFCTPLFFLIKKVAVNASYRDSETTYLLSLLSTAVRQALLQQQWRGRSTGAVLRMRPSSAGGAPGGTAAAATTLMLPSPFVYPDGCAPCFAPAGDSYKQTFVGLAPPLPACAVLPPPPSTSPSITTAEWTLLHQRVFTTRFLADAFGRAPENCQTLGDYIDLFQLHVGQHSRIRSDDFDGICVSLWKEYELPLPWRFHPCGPVPASAAAASPPSLTWETVLRRENDYTRLLCGVNTHDFGTTAAPLKHVRFHFRWNQLQDVEAHEVAGRASHLDPFEYALAHSSASAAAQAARRKCSITAQAVPRDSATIEHGVSARLSEVLTRGYLDTIAEATAGSASVALSDSNEDNDTGADDGDGGGKAGDERGGGPGGSGGSSSSTHARVRAMATSIVEWAGATVTLQESLLARFAALAVSSDEDDDGGGSGSGGGAAKGAGAGASGKRGEAVVARHLRSLWGEWEAHQQGCSGAVTTSEPGRRAGAAAAREKDIRRSYFPDSFFARFSYVCVTEVVEPADVQALWRRCLEALRRMLLDPAAGQEQRSWQRLLDCLALPPASPPVDLEKPLLTQKLQLLRYAVEALLRRPQPATAAASPADETATSQLGSASSQPPQQPVRRLITDGAVLCAPPPLPQPPITADVVLQRAMELNTRGAAAVECASLARLRSDALYNDMCLFLYANKAHEGRVVRFPDFIQWHSPRDFILPADAAAPGVTRGDDDYLSERMQRRPTTPQQQQQQHQPTGEEHVWWALWSRATPRSRDDIVEGLFQPLEQAVEVLDWLAAMPAAELLLEVNNASLANALHRLLCHRCVLGDDSADAPGDGSGPRGVRAAAAPTSSIPRTRCIVALHRYLTAKCTALTKDVEAASALFLGHRTDGATSQQAALGSQAMLAEMLRSLIAGALDQLGEMEVSVCTAVAVQYLLGFTTDPETAHAIEQLSSPAPLSQQLQHPASLQTRAVTVSMATWSTAFAKQFVRADTREVQASAVRLTCMAERPLDTCGCFQQLVVQQDASHSLRLALALTKEVM
ncbi:Rab3 GTPase-activating protein catalytic subunit [Novymonas esmeraldas]|uniref:Rab3 GTPase-activating protein catalytic subunit n=1 Tax=Novymonas esmeraldas TaxID=1808958 RepID=A0AAW0ELQ2_9TRYP